jgi:mRNA interferase MazF
MWKRRPVVIAGHRDLRIKGSALVLPISTDPQERNPWAWELPAYVTDRLERRRSWVICNHLTTISTSRLMQVGGGVVRLQVIDMNRVLSIMHDWLPKPQLDKRNDTS